MNSKANQIIKQQARQKIIKEKIKSIKKKVPTYVISFIFFTFLALYFFEEKLHTLFGNTVDIFRGAIIFVSVLSLIFIFQNYLSIKKKEKELKAISSKLYKLMRLDTEVKNE